MTKQSTITNSLEQVNRDNQAWKDRHDVDKTWEEWEKKRMMRESRKSVSITEVKAFARFFAEQVKGAPISYRAYSKLTRCHKCLRPYYPHQSEAELKSVFCCVACENGY